MRFGEFRSALEVPDAEIASIFELMIGLSNEVYATLGEGFPEEMYQKALQVEMREKNLRFQREVNIEIFYKNVPLGFDRPDFIIRPFENGTYTLSKPVVVELKAVKKLGDKHKTQAKTYLRSLPHASDGELKECRHCILINFPDNGSDSVEAILIESYNP